MNRFQDDPAPTVEPAFAPPPPPGHHGGMRHRHPHEPIVAAYHPSTTERVATAFRVHKNRIAAVTALVIALVLGIIGTTVGMVRAARQRDEALTARAEAERL